MHADISYTPCFFIFSVIRHGFIQHIIVVYARHRMLAASRPLSDIREGKAEEHEKVDISGNIRPRHCLYILALSLRKQQGDFPSRRRRRSKRESPLRGRLSLAASTPASHTHVNKYLLCRPSGLKSYRLFAAASSSDCRT